MSSYILQLKELILADPLRMQALVALKQLKLSDCWIAAGFIRNLVWDYLHQQTTQLNDIDVIFFDAQNLHQERENEVLEQLKKRAPDLPWSVKNQAIMHSQNGDPPYRDCKDAMSYWPEKQTAVAVRLNRDDQIELIHCFALEHLFSKKITHNPKRARSTFDYRVGKKAWLSTWNGLRLE